VASVAASAAAVACAFAAFRTFGGGGLWKTGTKEKRRQNVCGVLPVACGLWRRSFCFACGLWRRWRHRRRPVACAFAAFRFMWWPLWPVACASAFRFGGGLWWHFATF